MQIDMLSISVKQISEGLRNKRIDLLDLSEACLKRAREINSLNAFIRITEDSFLQRAHEARKRYVDGKPRSIIEGIPVAIKDNFCTKSIPTTCASRMLENFKPPYDATVVERLNDAGACMLGKTNMDEFAMGSGTVDSIFGPTKNIWRSGIKYTLKYNNGNGTQIPRPSYETPVDGAGEDWFIAGGSSGGSAVAVASGACFIAIGSDTGGSTRNPAAYCGVVGMKPSYGLVSRHGLIPLVNSMDVPGIFGRSVDDVCCVLGNISGHDSKDSTTVPASLEDIVKEMGREAPSDISRLCVGIPKEYHCPGMSPEVISMWGDVADTLEKAGAKVIEVRNIGGHD
ncbi:hypothetical protein J437_LFUL016050 [Ladona fulva]|uniref:Amidase domain-containing protein n=1 Tax=Ladona fulva TaxID=123851 RepID=A0A8K0P9T2_LADFU|nr:hypothetical protein J437_LFUL016050 [Ladona fulva]